MTAKASAPLRLPGFAHLSGAYTINELGNWLGEIALAVLVYDQTGSPLATAALFLGMQFLPALVSQGLIAGTEFAGTRALLPLLYLAEAATFVALAMLVDNFALWAIVALAALDGTLAIAARAFTRAAAVNVLRPAGQLRQGNALLNIAFTAAGAAGPLLAGVVVASFGVKTALLLDAASFTAAALVLRLAWALPELKSERHHWRGRFRDGLNYVMRRAALRRLMFAQAAAFVFFSAVLPIEIVYANESLGAGSSGYGALLAAWGGGMLVGSLIFAGSRRIQLRTLLLFSTIAVGVAYVAMGLAPSLAVACAAAALGGVGNGVQWVSILSAIQDMTKSQYQARVIGLLESIGSLMPGVGFMLGGLLAFTVGPRISFFVAGGGVLLVVAIAAPMMAKSKWGKGSADGLELSAADDISVEPLGVATLP